MTATPQATELTRIAAKAAASKLGTDIVAFDVSDRLAITDTFLIVSASNERQVGAVVDAIEEALYKAGARKPRREGDLENRWVLLDFIDIVVHVMHTQARVEYSLERLWRDCPAIDLQLDEPAPPAGAGE